MATWARTLKRPDGRRVFHRLLEGADVVHHNFSGGVLEKLGIGEAAIRSRKPDAVISSISAFGAPGYRTGWRGREELGQALTGMQMRYGGYGSPRMIFMPLNDFGSGNYSAFATMVAVYHRLRTGQAQSTHASLAHTGTFHQVPYMVALTVDEAMEEEPARQRGLSLVRELADGRRIRTVTPAGRLSLTPAVTGFLVKAPGGDGQAVLEDVGLGEEFQALVEQHVVARELPSGIETVGRFRAAETGRR
ncbi:MAG: CoA transferase [Candidatus Dormibacteraeota bacterium]|nr:CoA transferase [Candidatus Dormibacteraeota bacterium]MBO0760535.1 CoA transferase [Candidatus Dormibacteraeota bacterium]